MTSGEQEAVVTVIEPGPPPVPPARGRRLGPSVGLVLLVATALLGSNLFGLRDRLFGSATPAPTTAAGSRLAGAAPATTTVERTRLRSQPWWQAVTSLSGAGPATATPFAIDDGAIQWRVKWTCDSGHLLVQAPQAPKPVVDAACPRGPAGFGTRTGSVTLDVKADGPWKLEVEQQVDVPLVEPPLPAMTAPGAAVVATGSLYRIDQSATGTVSVYRLADGSHALRLEGFFVSPSPELEVRMSPLKAPKTSDEFAASPSTLVARLDVTTGSVNFMLPDTVDPAEYGSVVIWCKPVDSAYGAATLERAQ